MPTVTIRQGGADPARDGDLNLYASPEARSKSWFNQQRRVVFINGMGNTPRDHARSARALSLLQGCPVVGVYNRTDGFWADLGQCLRDKITLVGAQAGSFAAWNKAVTSAHAAATQKNRGLSREQFVGSLIAANPATHALYSFVVNQSAGARKALRIYCHSQGNLVTSNALTAAALALGEDAIRGLEINSFGSPCRYWPRGLNRTNNAFTFDPVTWLDLRIGFDSVKVGFVAGHGFAAYMKHDAEFVVNRFRWGSFGITASMDEAGLAKYCVGIGNNPPRLKAIWTRLWDAHWSDRDDVTEIYVKTMRTKHASVMKTIAAADRDLIKTMIRCLERGWTTGGERTEISYLQGLIA
jgi:hypothetical protein